MKTDLITKGAAVKAVLDWMDLHKREVIHKQDIAEIIMQLPKEEPSYDDIWEYCRRRCLTIMTNELFNELAERYSISKAEEIIRCKDCDNWHDGMIDTDCYWDKEYHYENPLPDDYCSRAERKKDE